MKSFHSEKILIWNSGTQEQTFFSLPVFLISKLHLWLRLCRAVTSVQSVEQESDPKRSGSAAKDTARKSRNQNGAPVSNRL